MRTLKPNHGRFEGNRSQMLAKIVWERSLTECIESIESTSACGFACRLAGKRYSFIVQEDDSGFVYVTTYRQGADDYEYYREWEEIVASLGGAK